MFVHSMFFRMVIVVIIMHVAIHLHPKQSQPGRDQQAVGCGTEASKQSGFAPGSKEAQHQGKRENLTQLDPHIECENFRDQALLAKVSSCKRVDKPKP